MKAMINISVIIPVYNVENYLDECIKSVCNQTFTDFEIVVVNDGSTDSSLSIIEKYARFDSRIRIFSQENRGISAARNKGFNEARGAYILFVDSDDYIIPNTLSALWEYAEETKSEIILGNVWLFFNDDLNNKKASYKRPESIDNDGVFSGENLYAQLMQYESFPPLVYLFFTKRSYLIENNILMDETLGHEDELWTVLVMCQAKRVKPINFYYYYYRQRMGSFMYSNNLHYRLRSMLSISKLLVTFIHDKQATHRIEKLNWIYVRIFWMYLQTTYMFERLTIMDYSYYDYYRSLLIEVFSGLNYEQQIQSLKFYNLATLKLVRLEKLIKAEKKNEVNSINKYL